MRKYLLILSLLIGFFKYDDIYSQYQYDLTNHKSPECMVSEKLGFNKISINYSSPSIRGRKIFGKLVPWGEVWRAGANAATTIEFSEDVSIYGKKVKAGIYAFFVIPNQKGAWKIILNREYNQWGAFNYQSKYDALRIKAYPQHQAKQNERLNYHISPIAYNKANIVLEWSNLKLGFALEVDFISSIKKKLEEKDKTLNSDIIWVSYLQAAEIVEATGENLQYAKSLAALSEKYSTNCKNWNPNFYSKSYVLGHLYWVSARIAARLNDYKSAVKFTNKLLGLEDKSFYLSEKEAENIDKLFKVWYRASK